MIFEQDFIDFIELLNQYKVEYMVVGATRWLSTADRGTLEI
jgi:hypothetical protein